MTDSLKHFWGCEFPFDQMEIGQKVFAKWRRSRHHEYIGICAFISDGKPDKNGELTEPQDAGYLFDGALWHNVNDLAYIWPYVQVIDENEYKYLLKLSQWNEANNTEEHELDIFWSFKDGE